MKIEDKLSMLLKTKPMSRSDFVNFQNKLNQHNTTRLFSNYAAMHKFCACLIVHQIYMEGKIKIQSERKIKRKREVYKKNMSKWKNQS